MLPVRVVGVTFVDGYPRNLADLAVRCTVDPPDVELRRDYDNEADLNAVGVWVEGRRVGWLPRDIAARVAPRMDKGHRFTGATRFVAVDLEHRERPGLEIEIGMEA